MVSTVATKLKLSTIGIAFVLLTFACFSVYQNFHVRHPSKDSSNYNNNQASAILSTFHEINTNEIAGLRKENGAPIKGEALLKTTWIQNQLSDFIKAYDQRPDGANKHGSKLMHQFALWCIIKKLQPKHIIESGIYMGLGTWIIRQAAPDAQMIMIDPHPVHALYKDRHNDTLYFIKDKFLDFAKIDWIAAKVNPNETLVFVDDHQYPVRRLAEGLLHGFKYFIFDDNYDSPGDVFSLRQLCKIFQNETSVSEFHYTDQSQGKNKKFNRQELLQDAQNMFSKNIQVYWEFPMIWRCLTCNTNNDNANILIDSTDGRAVLKDYGLKNVPSGEELKRQYYNIAFVQLK